MRHRSPFPTPKSLSATVAAAMLALFSLHGVAAQQTTPTSPDTSSRLVTGKLITPQGTQAPVGSIPIDLVATPDGKYVLVSSMGSRAFVSVLSEADGHMVSQCGFNGPNPNARGREGLYYGIALGPTAANGATPVYAARGSDHVVSVLSLAADGTLTNTGTELPVDGALVAGLATDAAGQKLYVADNTADPGNGFRGSVKIIGVDGTQASSIDVAGYPYAVAAVTRGANAGRKVYVSCEQGGVFDLDPTTTQTIGSIATGDHPLALCLNAAQSRLYVANANSDTVSMVDTSDDRVTQTVLLSPPDVRGLPGATPTGLALSPDERTLYVSLGDFNAVALVNTVDGTVAGYIPAGWYPSAVAVSQDGKRLFVANAKGVVARTPNGVAKSMEPGAPASTYTETLLEGTVSTIDLAAARADLKVLTARTLANNLIRPNLAESASNALVNPGIKHIIYIVKENRTYDQVLGDDPRGNGDPTLTLFGKNVTPNLHALADRFVLLDNFFCCGEVSGDGWVWSTAGLANPYVIRNVPYSYTGHAHSYDYEGTNDGASPDLAGVADVSAAEGGYIWDAALRKNVTIRNYGFLCDDFSAPRVSATEGTTGLKNSPTKRALTGRTDQDFREFDLRYADSDAWVQYGFTPLRKQLVKYGSNDAPARIVEWKREFDDYVKNGDLPQLELVRLMTDHTAGTSAGAPTPSAMVADNDYAVGELVDAVSHSPYWKSTAIFIVEDDAQNGNDHVDCHRGPAYVISPFIQPGLHDSRFYNTDSVLHTIEALLGLAPMSQYDAIAPVMDIFSKTPDNDAPYSATPADRSVMSQVNTKEAYRAGDSARYFPRMDADAGPVDQTNEIIWHTVKGNKPMPPPRFAFAAEPAGERDAD